METTLNTYLKRCDEILQSEKCIRHDNEFKLMISFLEETLEKVKSKYNLYRGGAGETRQIEAAARIIGPPIAPVCPPPVNCSEISLDDLFTIDRTFDNKLCWSPDLNQYCIRINGILLRGNIGNIYDKKILLNDKINAHQVMQCVYGDRCPNILSEKYCKFYHDPLDLYKLWKQNKISEDYYQKTIKYVRNFANTSWMYTSAWSIFKIPQNMRIIGSKSTLKNELSVFNLLSVPQQKFYIENMKQQIMHDILVLMFILKKNI